MRSLFLCRFANAPDFVCWNWKPADFEPELALGQAAENLESGRNAFDAAGCAQCHRFNEKGGSVGPDLSGLAKRMKPTDVLEAILEPSRTIPDEYALQQFTMSDGEAHVGQVQEENSAVVILRGVSATGAPLRLAKALIVSRKKLNVSNMPPGTVNTLQKQQILDLIAYLLNE